MKSGRYSFRPIPVDRVHYFDMEINLKRRNNGLNDANGVDVIECNYYRIFVANFESIRNFRRITCSALL